MKIEIDRNGCIGNGNCESVCPELFALENGKARVIQGEVDASRQDEVIQAAADCPVQVITVWDGPRRVYPPKR